MIRVIVWDKGEITEVKENLFIHSRKIVNPKP